MLTQIYIENVAVIERALIDFGKGLHVFTGETGAGKSILIDALSMALGFRSSKDLVRSGEKRAFVSASFDELLPHQAQCLAQLGFDTTDRVVVLSREITQAGKTSCKINGRTATVAMLGEIGRLLVDIHGQHENQQLLHPESHMEYIDRFGGLEEQLTAYRTEFKKLGRLLRQINDLSLSESEKAAKIARLNEQMAELEGISGEERAELLAQRRVLYNAEKLAGHIGAAYAALVGEDDAPGCTTLLKTAQEAMAQTGDFFEPLPAMAEQIADFYYQLEDISATLGGLLEEVSYDPVRLEEIETRLSLYDRLEAKYAMDIQALCAAAQNWHEELDGIELSQEKAGQLKEEYHVLAPMVKTMALELSEKRLESARRLIERIEQELQFLNMPGVKLALQQETTPLTKYGMDRLSLLISANAGEPPKPLAKIASGGELSRIMLAIKNVLARKDLCQTLIFDEVDAGISGRAAQKVGVKLKELAEGKQVVCVTHLAQIACFADCHLLIEKQVSQGRTHTEITALAFEARKKELARIISGKEDSQTALQTAGEMLYAAGRKDAE